MSTHRLTQLCRVGLAIAMVAVCAACARRPVIPAPNEYPAETTEKKYDSDSTDKRAPYVVDEPVPTPTPTPGGHS